MIAPETLASPVRAAWPADAIRAAPLDYLAAERARMRALANSLEWIADALPGVRRPATLIVAASGLRRCALRLLPIEDAALMAPVEAGAPDGALSRRIVELVRGNGALLAGQALELADILEARAEDGAVAEAEALGFMLRACFDALRRRAEWIEAAILPQCERLLDAAALVELGERLALAADSESLHERCGLAVIEGAEKRPRDRFFAGSTDQ
jgi:hypothetical protein